MSDFESQGHHFLAKYIEELKLDLKTRQKALDLFVQYLGLKQAQNAYT